MNDSEIKLNFQKLVLLARTKTRPKPQLSFPYHATKFCIKKRIQILQPIRSAKFLKELCVGNETKSGTFHGAPKLVVTGMVIVKVLCPGNYCEPLKNKDSVSEVQRPKKLTSFRARINSQEQGLRPSIFENCDSSSSIFFKVSVIILLCFSGRHQNIYTDLR